MNFAAGQHSFYGICKMTIVSGNPSFHGAELHPGSSFDLIAPLHRLPLSCESRLPFSVRISAHSPDMVLPEESKYYFPKSPPDGFVAIVPGLFYSQLIRGATYSSSAHRFIDSVIQKGPSRLFVCGEKGRGKSTFCALLANRVLNGHREVCFVDLDPGQTEFSLPGFLSLSILTDFVTGPAEFRTSEGQTVVFYGSLAPGDYHGRYLECVRFLVDRIPRDKFTIVNSFGWIQDLGLELHRYVLDILAPDTTFMLHRPDETPVQLPRKMFRLDISPGRVPVSITAAAHRALRINGHFRRGNGFVSNQQPIPVDLTAVRIGFICVAVEPAETLTAICGALVGLCNDPREFPPPRRKVSLVKEVPLLEVAAVALVKAVDRKNGILYLLCAKEPEAFNTVVMGAVSVPSGMYTDTTRATPNYLGIGTLERPGASANPLIKKQNLQQDG
jgi:polynucleotide 5'-hydroxyl-kinase GRC3/NOL9